MKKLIYIILFIISILNFAQKPANRFEAEESATAVPKEEVTSARNNLEDPGESNNGGNPGDIVPIDDYIPLLIITAVGLIIFSQYYKRPSS